MVIGLDFGNYNSAPCILQGMNDVTHLGGAMYRLIPPEYPYGIPSVYFYTNQHGISETYVGHEAVSMKAIPWENQLRYLKLHLNETVRLDDRNIEINDAITEVIQFCIREANMQLKQNFGETTNQIALAYPVSYTIPQRMKLVELAERATLEDGTHVQVIGTIAEPAAAALDYLAVQHKTEDNTTVLVYDLGGGTFDLSLVKATPQGESLGDYTCYYRVLAQTGDSQVGGVKFDEALFKLLLQKIKDSLKGDSLNAREELHLKEECEHIKIELSRFESISPMITHYGDTLDISVTRDEFEAATKHLLDKTIELTSNIINDPALEKPDCIVLTGGSSQMPMVENALKKAFPEYAEKIITHNPTMSIACGAARYGVAEIDMEPDNQKTSTETVPWWKRHNKTKTFVQSLDFDVGVRLIDPDTGDYIIEKYLEKGTPLPTHSKWNISETRYEGQRSTRLIVFQSIVNDRTPNPKNLDDYREIMNVIVDHGKKLPKGTKTKAKIVADRKGFITIEAFSQKNAAVHCTAVYATNQQTKNPS